MVSVQNGGRVLASYFKTYGEIRPDALADLKATSAPSADPYDALMQSTAALAQSPENAFKFRADAGRHSLQINPSDTQCSNEDMIGGSYSGDANQGELHVCNEFGGMDKPDRRVEQDDVFFQGDYIFAIHDKTVGQTTELTVDVLNRKDASQSVRYEMSSDAEWLQGWTGLGELSFPQKR